MTLYVRNESSRTITANQLGAQRFELLAKGNAGSIKVLPLNVATLDGFQRAWAAGDVSVSRTANFASTITEIPADEQYGGAATTTLAGNVKQAAAQANSTATDAAGAVADLNALLAKLRTAGIVAT